MMRIFLFGKNKEAKKYKLRENQVLLYEPKVIKIIHFIMIYEE
jgi:hypothetical protein